MAAACKTGGWMHAILEYTAVAIWGVFHHFEARQTGEAALGLCVTAVAFGRLFCAAPGFLT